jgi:hypothetical protein
VLQVSASGYYEWKTRAPSARSIRHALLTGAIREVHTVSRGTYGFRRVTSCGHGGGVKGSFHWPYGHVRRDQFVTNGAERG